MRPVLSLTATPAIENTSNGFGPGQLAIIVSLSEPATEQVNVSYRLRDGSAQDDDLLYLSTWFRNFGTLTFDIGETEQTIFIETAPDTFAEPTESFRIELYNPVGASFANDGPLLQTLGLILDDDGTAPTEPEVFVTSPVVVMSGGPGHVSFDLHLAKAALSDLTYTYALTGQNVDPMTGVVTIPAGALQASLTLPVAVLSLDAGHNRIDLRLTPTHAGETVTSGATILVPEASIEPTLFILSDTGLENVGPVDGRLGFTVILSHPTDEPVSVEYYLSAASANDLDLDEPLASDSNTGTLTIAPGETVATVQVALQTDSIAEQDEVFSIHLINPIGAVFPSNTPEISAHGVIRDNDSALPMPSLVIKDTIQREDGIAKFEIELSHPATEDMTLRVQTRDGTAQSGADYTALDDVIAISAGQTHTSVSVAVDEMTTGRFFLIAQLADDTDTGQSFTIAEADLSSTDPNQPAVIKATGFDLQMIDGQNGTVRFLVQLSHASAEEVGVNYRVSTQGAFDPTASGLLAASGVAQFAAGQTSQIIEIDLDAGKIGGSDFGLWLDLFDPLGAALSDTGDGSRTLAVVQTASDETPRLFLTQITRPELAGDTQTAIFEIRLSRPAETATEVTYATHLPVGGIATSGTVYFEQGQTSAYIRLPIASGINGPTQVSARMTGTDAPIWATIETMPATTADAPIIRIDGGAVLENSGIGSNELPFVITLSSASTETVQIDYETRLGTAEPNDLSENLMSGTVSFQPGQTQITLPVSTRFDALPEPDETVFVTLTNPQFATLDGGGDALSAVGFLIDEDGAVQPTVAAADTQLFEGETVQIAVHLSRALAQDTAFTATLSGDAQDAVLSDTTFTFLAGQTTAYLSVSAIDDGRAESPETLGLTLMQINGPIDNQMQTDIAVTVKDRAAGPGSGPIVEIGSTQADQLFGGAFDDMLTGLDGDDQLFGAAGDDVFLPGLGSDSVSGGSGVDTISFVDAQAAVSVDMVQGSATSGMDRDMWTDIENITGSIFGDFVLTDDGSNRIRTLGSYDWIVGSDGADFIDGGAGRDMLSYVYAPSRVVVDLGLGRGLDGQAAGDRFTNIERLTGSIYSDRFLGSAGADDFRGLGGDDWFVGSDGGRDRYDGGTGRDTVAYSLASTGVTASLSDGIFGTGQAALDLFNDIENLTGSSFEDHLIGDSGRNVLRGLYGTDHLEGRGGNDRLQGGALDDVLDGGAGWDVAVYLSNAATYQIRQTGTSYEVRALGTSRDGTDTLIDIEAIQFADTLVFL